MEDEFTRSVGSSVGNVGHLQAVASAHEFDSSLAKH